MNNAVTWVECPRDAMQGLHTFIPTETKIAYLNTLLQVGFHTLDFGSFVSPTAIPQLRDTAEVLKGLNRSLSNTRLLAIVANLRGAQEACSHEAIHDIGYPFSISETFQQRNTHASLTESLVRVGQIQELCRASGKQLVVYLSMAFGNPYEEPWSPALAMEWGKRLADMGIGILALSDTIGVATTDTISELFGTLIPAVPEVEWGAHLHSTPDSALLKLAAAWEAGCRRFDTAIHGFGGCPMAKDDLTGNMATEILHGYLQEQHGLSPLHQEPWQRALQQAWEVFPKS
jgi:hydroxymethylglutaryl-CoA lyase